MRGFRLYGSLVVLLDHVRGIAHLQGKRVDVVELREPATSERVPHSISRPVAI